MLKNSSASSLKFLLLLTVSGVWVCAAAAAVQGQTSTWAIEKAEREMKARQSERERDERKQKRDPNEVMAEVNDDLRQLYQLNEAIAMHTTTTNPSLDYDSIFDGASEIKKRSSRLKMNLALPKAESKEKLPDFKDAEQGELRPALSTLNKLLDSFLHNPIFSDSGEIDMQLATRARCDLDSIVVLSEKVRKNAEKRSKLSAKTQ